VVNLASPIVGVPFPTFLTALLVGHLPINFISVKVCLHVTSLMCGDKPRLAAVRAVHLLLL
jgi:hypothetical protein